MGIVGRLDQYASMLAGEFDDYSMSENLIKNSENLTIAVGFWSEIGDGVTVTTNQATAPDGTQTADKVAIKNTNGGSKAIQSSILNASVIGQAYTASIFCKAAEHNYVRIDVEGGGNNGGIVVDLSNGSLILQVSAPDTYSIQAYPNGWYRISATSTASTTNASALRVYLTNVSGSIAFVGTTGNGVYIWGGQYESSSNVTDYTPTTTTAKTRVLPSTTNINITGFSTYFSSGFSENVGVSTTLVANVFPPYDLVYDDFGGTLFGAGQGRYMRQNTDKSVIVYNEIDEVSDFRDIVRTGLVLDLDAAQPLSYKGTGTAWNDLSGNGNNGTLVNGVGYNSNNGGSLSFDGVNAYISFNSNPLLTNQMSAEVWVKLNDPQGVNASGLILGRESSYRMLYSSSAIDWICATTNNGWYTTGTVISAGSVTPFSSTLHIVGTYDGVNNKIYINGTLRTTGSSISGDILTNGTYYLMRTTAENVDYGQGNIYSHKLYNRALTATEITQNYNALKHRFGL